jgi:hypothetical protein
MPPGRFRRALAAASVAVLAASCGPQIQVAGDVPAATFPSRESLPSASSCVTDPDPANGGRPSPPPEVTEAGDPADPTGVVAMEAIALGDLALPSGRLLVADVFALVVDPTEMPSLELAGSPDRVPVCLHLARYDPPDERVAFVHLQVDQSPVTRWVEVSAFAVDGGTGGIASPEAVLATGPGFEATLQQYIEVLEHHTTPSWSWLDITTDAVTGANIIGFSTGFGDGRFPVVAGYDADGRVVSVVLDHLVVPWAWLGRIGAVAPPG